MVRLPDKQTLETVTPVDKEIKKYVIIFKETKIFY